MSTFSLYFYLSINSGAMYIFVPNFKSKPSFGLKRHENPKSVTRISKFVRSLESKSIFYGFKSRCTI